MTVVLDSSAVVALAWTQRDEESPVGNIIESELCYMSPISVAETYHFLYDHASEQQADHWLRFLIADTDDVRIETDADREFLELVSEALHFGVPYPVAFCGALARRKKAPVLTSKESFDDLRRAGFCEVRKF